MVSLHTTMGGLWLMLRNGQLLRQTTLPKWFDSPNGNQKGRPPLL